MRFSLFFERFPVHNTTCQAFYGSFLFASRSERFQERSFFLYSKAFVATSQAGGRRQCKTGPTWRAEASNQVHSTSFKRWRHAYLGENKCYQLCILPAQHALARSCSWPWKTDTEGLVSTIAAGNMVYILQSPRRDLWMYSAGPAELGYMKSVTSPLTYSVMPRLSRAETVIRL